ncbi:MAG: prepilin-type N-terminal cleavage/methylation domain-containing protein [Sumerlaeia bacterium]
MKTPSFRRGFTLIELLIVVAIIAILAAIAVPNFLEAQTRSKISRAQADMRTIATGLEAYRVDTNKYPKEENLFGPFTPRLAAITSPIAYLTSVPNDPFFQRAAAAAGSGIGQSDPAFYYASGNLGPGGASVFDTPEATLSLYSLASRGPDLAIFMPYCVVHPVAKSRDWDVVYQYDPTNGTISDGEIFRFSPGTIGG